MLYFRVFILLLCVLFGCGGEQPLDPDESGEDAAGGNAPEAELPTAIVSVRSHVERIQTVTHRWIPTQTFVVIDGELTERIVFFQDEPQEGYYHLIPIQEIDGEFVGGDTITVLNVLDQKIVAVQKRIEDGAFVFLDEPIQPQDRLEVVIKGRFTYIMEYTFPVWGNNNRLVGEKDGKKGIEIIFAEIKRNLSRPEWNHAFQ